MASGSTGNSTLLETGRTTLLIDAGVGKKELLRRFAALGRALPERVNAILVTHEHTDHSNALAQLARHWNCPAYFTEPTHREIVRMFADDPANPGKKATFDRVEYVRAGERFEIGDVEINAFRIPNDAADPIGFAFRANGTKVAITTDLGYLPEHVKQHLRDADFLMLESNHDLEMLKV
ncbi:MAG: MBL fold metallo-hydrolase, partial [Terracidiphilus sp.]